MAARSPTAKCARSSRNHATPTDRKAVWEGSKGVGPLVEPDLKALVKLRNEAARKLGFADYHKLQLHLNEQSQDQVLKLFDELDVLTREPFRKLKSRSTASWPNRAECRSTELRPWHYHDPFFQEAPAIFAADFDSVYAKADILKLCRDFYAGIGLPIDDVIARSDLYEKPGKSPHAFCTDIDREGDVRVLANIVPNEYWMGTMLHELGHSVYSSKNIPRSRPLRAANRGAHPDDRGDRHAVRAILEGRRLAAGDGGARPGPGGLRPRRRQDAPRQASGFLAVGQVMFRFEKAMYDNPDQDLNTVWWDLVERYQLVHRPDGRQAPDYASKIHIVSAPAYYHNYLMGELFATQVLHAIARDVLNGVDPGKASFAGNKAVGDFLKTRIFTPGRSLDWNGLTKHATGEALNAKAFAAEIGRE